MNKPFKPNQTPGIDCCISCGETKDIKKLPWTPEDSDLYCKKHREKVRSHAAKSYIKDNPQEIEGEDQLIRVILIHLASRERSKATERIVQHILKKNHIYTTRDDEKPEMWIYDTGIYRPNGRSYVTEIVREILREAFTTSLCNDIQRKIEADTFVDQEEFFSRQDNEPHLLPVENGMLNINTKELQGFSPQKFFFNKLPVKYNPEADCPEIKKFMNTILKPEDVKPVQEFLGFCLLREYKYEKSMMFSGDGRNGKGKTLDLFRRLLGIENCAAISLQDIEKDPFAVGELHAKLLNVAGDISSEAIRNSGMYKSLTGRDLVTAARKFKTRVSFVNYAKMMFSANELPRTKDLSPAFFDRWILIEFPFRFLPKKEIDALNEEERFRVKLQDPTIIEKIATAEELSGMLNWALEGYARLRENKDFSYGATSSEVKNAWIRKSDSFMAFCMDELEEAYDGEIKKSELRQQYQTYCRKHRLKSVSDRIIKSVLAENYGVSEGRSSTQDRERVWVGARLKNHSVQDVQEVHHISPYIGNTISKASQKTLDKMDILDNTKKEYNLLPIDRAESSYGTCASCGEERLRTFQDSKGNLWCQECGMESITEDFDEEAIR